MTRKSGWCLDEVQYRYLDNHNYADKLHNSCPFPDRCPCEKHKDD